MSHTVNDAERIERPKPTFPETLRIWANIGLLSFGGPTAQIALMHRVIVEEKAWLSENQFLNALSFCMLLPGPEAMQLATYAGWRLHGVKGGVAAGLLFVLPGAMVILALSAIYAAFGQVPLVEAVFFGIKASVLVIVVEALLRISKRALTARRHWILAALSFIAIFFLALPFPLIVALAALFGFWRRETQPAPDDTEPAILTVRTTDSLRTILTWLAAWLAPLAALTLWLGRESLMVGLGWFFSKLAIVTFGGAYAVLAYMGQDVVVRLGWLEAGEMIDGLGLAETTPGPLILVTEFVGYLAAHNHGGEPRWLMGLAGAGIALWMTFAPCFLWIFSGAPYIEWINHQPRLKSALQAITAAVVGVILNLSLWFALHVFFANVRLQVWGPLNLWVPDIATLDWGAVAIACFAAYLLLKRHWAIPWVLAVAAGLALTIRFVPL